MLSSCLRDLVQVTALLLALPRFMSTYMHVVASRRLPKVA